MTTSQTSTRSSASSSWSTHSRSSITSAITVSVLITKSVSYLPLPNPSELDAAAEPARPWPYTRPVVEETIIYPAKASRRSRASMGTNDDSDSLLSESQHNQQSQNGRRSSHRSSSGSSSRDLYVGFPTTSVEYYPSGATLYSRDATNNDGSSGNAAKLARKKAATPPILFPITTTQSSYSGKGDRKDSGIGSACSGQSTGKAYDMSQESWNFPAATSPNGNRLSDVLINNNQSSSSLGIKSGSKGGFWRRR